MQTGAPDHGAIDDLARRIFPGAYPLLVTLMAEGVSTWVYRVDRGDEVYYLRVLPEEGDSFAPEAWVHTELGRRGLAVPDVVYLEHCNAGLGRSVMVTTAIPGRPLSSVPDSRQARAILIEAGRALAIINSVPVWGFGWITRDSERVTHLQADLPTARAFVLDGLDADLALLAHAALSQDEAATASAILHQFDAWLAARDAWLAHGDFDVTHIYQQDGRYTGIIDFGEIRGTPPLYDLGHFRMHDGETLPAPLLPALLEGYGQIVPLPPDHAHVIARASLLIAVRMLARRLRKDAARVPAHWITAVRRDLRLLS